MVRKTEIKVLWGIAVACIAIMSATILIMPIAVDINNSKREWMLLINGIVFWGTILIGYAAWIIAIFISRNDYKQKSKYKLGLFRNIPTTFFDVIFMVSISWLLISILIRKSEDYSIYICLFSLVLSLNMHGLFSGNLYKTYIKIKE